MFGKGKTGMSSTHKFIMAAGQKAGNLKPPPVMKMKTGKMAVPQPQLNKAGTKGRARAGALGKVMT